MEGTEERDKQKRGKSEAGEFYLPSSVHEEPETQLLAEHAPSSHARARDAEPLKAIL